ncbi:acyl-CoA dehydrogenase [Streptomyces sp. R302]|uniref:acyl-CoA dehydrogenase n=1 Tax=unclassified Streptomyces TaxID=2593676 RepID=UPI00145FA9D6|nr:MULTISPECIES: acyl-CoA dehydrogenase [unclassified Streptomyces]NML49404.1 acyl-CoA dehydrogenase [Streptomyces sp. R301]NML77731.1 acyl-CoA dehydrogenase [Streptomyces sp. R302]
MGIAITHEQRDLARSVRAWLTRAAPPEELRRLLDAPEPPAGPPAYWHAAAAQGLLGIHVPEEHGGGGGGLDDLAVVVEETARALLPGPYLPSVLAAELLRRAGAHGPLLADLAEGRRVGAVALGGTGTLTAVRTGAGYLLDGTAPPVLGAAQADLLLLQAATADGTVWLAVDAHPADGPGPDVRARAADGPGPDVRARAADGPGPDVRARAAAGPGPDVRARAAAGPRLAVRPHASADPTRPTAEVGAAAVPVPADRALALDTGLVHDLAAVLFAADACGTAARAVDTAAEHARTREQFGHPIGKFQGVKHLCADMLVRLEQARALAWDAARAADDPARPLVAALAAATALDAAHTCAKDCVQILGGIGFTWEHDAHILLRRALVARQLLGTGDRFRLDALRHAATGPRRSLRLDLPAAAEQYREAARAAIAPAAGLDPAAARRVLARTGHAAPHLPEPYGLGAGPLQQLAVQRELDEAGVTIAGLSIATWVVPSLLAHGSPAQQETHLGPTLRGERRWCQLFSEPGAGSDLASLRTRAERTEDGGWRITGQKVWTSAAQEADFGILLARTDPAAPKHRGLSYFLVDMRNTPGIDIRPLKEITGDSLFNEVWFDGAVLPADAVVGEVGDGWRVARTTLGNERVHMADQVVFDTGLEALIKASAEADGSVRARTGALLAEAHALACIGLRTTLLQVSGLEPGAGASVRKLVQTLHQQKTAELALELLGPDGAVAEGAGAAAVHGFLMSRCLTIAGGTTQVQLNVVAERLLGLPRD